MKLKLKASSEKEFLTRYLNITNLLLDESSKLVDSEIELMVNFVLLPEKFKYQQFSPLAKRKVREAYAQEGKKLTVLNMNNKLHALGKKEFLRRDEDRIMYLPKHFIAARDAFAKDKSFELIVTWQKD
jgi:hypothetical protein